MLDSLSVQVNTKVSGYSTMVRMSGCAEGTGHGTSKAAFWVPLSGAPCTAAVHRNALDSGDDPHHS